MRLPEPFFGAGRHLAIDLPGSRALFTTRRGGVSIGPFTSLNLGRWTDDRLPNVEENHRRLADQLGVRFAYGRQVHGTLVQRAERPTGAHSEPPEADAQVTATPGIGVLVTTADCLPVAIAAQGAVAMVHAGWRGLADGVLERAVAVVRELSDAAPMAAAIGPGAGACCYEVGGEVHARFAGSDPHARHEKKLDMKAIARGQLERAGVDQVHDCGLCTICAEPTLFFSHRRDHGVTGRQAGVAWLS